MTDLPRLSLGQLRFRKGRAAALAGAILAAAAGFLLLASAGKTTDVRVQGSVRSAFRPAYDVLVRPRGSKTVLEQREGLVRPNFLSGVFGGITLAQYERIKRIRGIDVAAPIANVGHLLPSARVPIRINTLVGHDPAQLYRFRLTWMASNGLSRYPRGNLYLYYNRVNSFGNEGPTGFVEYVPGRRNGVPICALFTHSFFYPQATTGLPEVRGPFDKRGWDSMTCESAASPGVNNHGGAPLRPTDAGVQTAVSFPIFLAAIDPAQEARLLRLDGAIVGGRYLRMTDRLVPILHGRRYPRREVSVIVSARAYVDETLSATIERLDFPSASVPGVLGTRGAHSFLAGLRGRMLQQRSFPALRFYERVSNERELDGFNYWTTSAVRYRSTAGRRLEPIAVRNPRSIWESPWFKDGGFAPAPPSNQDVQFRRLQEHSSSNLFVGGAVGRPTLKVVGRYDPEKLPGFSPLSRVPLETYYPPLLEPGDARTSRLLGGKPLLPTQNIGDYIQQPPLVLTTLKSIPAFTNPKFWSNVDPRFRKAPISAIRIRVKGVKGPDALSIARIKAVAGKIHDETGLDVDITAGSSPHPVLIELPKGKFGRPDLLLREGWSKKGVSVSFLQALDKKRLGFLLLILATCCFVVANGAFASVRQRRAEIGTLLCLGWSPAQIFSALLLELLAIGLVAGSLGAALAAVVSSVFSLSLSLWQTLLVVPLALLLALASGLLPAWRASRLVPLDAVRPAIAGRVEGRRVRRLLGLALANLRRVPARSLVSAFGLAVGVCALMLIVAINASFQGTLVGTLLGSAVSLQVSGLDYLSVALIVSLSALALADVLYLNLRERQAELVTLRTLGWADHHLRSLVALEAALLGLAGSLVGAVCGLLVGIAVDLPLLTLLLAALAACPGGILVALIASLLPLSQIGRFRVPTVLAEE